jgi:hypothetical protein
VYQKKAQRGRPRQNNPLIDTGTPELLKKRNHLLRAHHSKNLALTESLLGLLYAREMISKPLYETGCHFGELGYKYISCLDCSFRARSSVLVLNRRGLSHLPDSYIEKQTKAWKRSLSALKQAGDLPYRTVMKVVFHDDDLHLYGIPPSLLKVRAALQLGLKSLDFYFKEGLKDKPNSCLDQASNH